MKRIYILFVLFIILLSVGCQKVISADTTVTTITETTTQTTVNNDYINQEVVGIFTGGFTNIQIVLDKIDGLD